MHDLFARDRMACVEKLLDIELQRIRLGFKLGDALGCGPGLSFILVLG